VSAGSAFAGLHDQAESLVRGEVSSRELVQRSLAGIEATQATLGAFRCVRAEAALAAADDADRRIRAGQRAPLLGVPVAIKDDLDLAGESTQFGCAGTFERKREDCEAVRRLKGAGAVIVGKTTTPELGQWPITEGSAFGVTRNPWNLQHTPGGSSGGSAAAVAAGLVAGAFGSDGLGSVRIPAAWTHLVGIKPQRGRISTWPEAEVFNGLSCIGPLARRVADAALLLDAAAGSHPGDLHRPWPGVEPFVAAASREPRRLRIALSLKAAYAVLPTTLDPELEAAVRRIAGVLSELGHEVQSADPPYGILGVGAIPRSLAGLAPWVRKLPDASLLDPRTRENARLGSLLRGPVLRAARAAERPMRHRIATIFHRFDVVLTPTTAQPPLRVGAIDGLSGWATDRLITAACPYAWPWNVIGWPAVSVPAGFTRSGLPVGAQLLGPAESEADLISLAAQLERVERWHEHRPPAPASVLDTGATH
jgi:amidase